MKIPSRALKLESYMPPWMNINRAAGALEGNSTLLDFAASLGVIPSPSALRGRARAANKTAGAGGMLAPRLRGDKEKGKFESLLSDFFSFFQSGGGQQKQQQQEDQEQDREAAPTAAEGADSHGRRLMQARALQELVGSDDRTNCSRGFPYSAIGQIQVCEAVPLVHGVCARGGGGLHAPACALKARQRHQPPAAPNHPLSNTPAHPTSSYPPKPAQVVDNTGLYICTGTLIAPNKVLTAGHCVWNIRRGAFYYNLNYAPGRFRDGGNIVNPWGVVPWKSVTVFDSFKKNPATWDVAVVTLAKPLGSLTGYMGIAAGCGRNLQLATAGYPQDKSPGTCMAATCMQRALDCENPTNPHVCDTKQGMSGSPLWDAKHRIRLIHVAGIDGLSENRATTLTQFLVNTVSKW
jgi:V8-like Glu-specific endopeptidase